MKKCLSKFTKILLLISMIFSELIMPFNTILAYTQDGKVEKGDVGINNNVVNEGEYATIYSGNYETDEALVTKKVTKVDANNGIYNVELKVKGKDKTSTNQVTKPIYVVIVFDTSGSMICDNSKGGYAEEVDNYSDGRYKAADGKVIACYSDDWYSKEVPSTLTKNKWESAVNGAVKFSEDLTKIANTNIALVTFSGTASNAVPATGWNKSKFTESQFGHPVGGTELDDGLEKAITKLRTVTETNAQKYIIVMSDGQPNSENDAISSAYKAKNENGITIYSIGYGIDNNTDAQTVLKRISSNTTITKTTGNRPSYSFKEDKEGYYLSASIEGITSSFKTIFDELSTSNAASNAVLTDIIGDNFNYVSDTASSNDISVSGKNVTINVGDVTETEKTYSFNIQIADPDSPTGWYRTNGNATNNSFTLTGTGLTNSITSSESAEVYWVQNTYDYKVNYYKDEISGTPFKSDTRTAPAGTIINESNVLKDKYLSDAGASYEYNSISPDSITITNDGAIKEINVLYVKAYGTLVVKHQDTNGEDLITPETTVKEITTDYTTSEKTIYGYTLKEVKGNETGKYVKGTTEVIYVYSKNAGSVSENEVTKAQINTILGANSTFKYTLSYNGKIENYVGDATLTLTDTLPYEVESIVYDTTNCSFDTNTRTLTCTKTYNINEQNKVINEMFTFEVVYKGLVNELDLNVKNVVNSKLTFGNTNVDDNSEVTDVVKAGKVIATYVDEAGNELADSVTTTGLGDTDYTTSEKTIYGYTLKGQPSNKTGKYKANETINVEYVYSKNTGKVTENEVSKTGPENVTSVNGVFNYTLSYNGKIEDYVGKATLTLTDTLPYEIDETNSKFAGCTYSNKVLTCVKEFDIDEDNQEVSAKLDLELVFKNIDSNKIVNKVDSLLTYGNNNKEADDETETEVFKGTVIATYVDEAGNELADSVTTTGLGDTDYTTSEKTIYGYTLKEVKGNKTGKYKANETINVEYVYSKNTGKVTENEVSKTGPENVTSVNGVFNYTLTYNGKIEDYVGDATLTLTDTLPYEIDETNSKFAGCTYSNKVLTCVKEFDIDEDNQEVSAKFDLGLVFKNIDSNKIVNKVDSLLTYGNNNKEDDDETETEVFKGTVVAIYKNRQGELLNQNIISTGLAGSDYETEELEFLGYTLTKLPENKDGKYVANQTINVVYLYDKNVGTSEEHLEKTGFEKVDGVDSAFEYKITYNLEVFDYVGDVMITLTDYLPFDIDLEKSDLGSVCKYTDGLLICEYKHTIKTEEDSVINIEENLSLYYKDIDSDKVVNRIESVVVYGDEEKFDEDEFVTEIPYGQIKVNYVTEDGKELSQSVISTGLVGADYKTSEKYFDDYYLKEVVGEEEGVYKDFEQEITYIYSEIPLPPQTGIDSNNMNYLGILVFAIVVLVLRKRYI